MPCFASYPSLKDRSVFVSGGGSGIGASIVEHFAAQGAKVGFVDIDEAASKALVAQDPRHRRRCSSNATSATSRPTRRRSPRWRAGSAPITVLVNNAARDDRHKLEDVTPEFWDERIAVNLRHPYFAIQAVAPGMKKAGGGSIVNFSSVSYHTMTADLSVYQAAKAAVIGMTRGLARDLGPDKIRLNVDHAGLDHDPAPDRSLADARGRGRPDEGAVPQGKGLSARHRPHGAVAGADDSRLMTAQNFVVDGGRM